MIFPEGTRFTSARRRHLLDRFQRQGNQTRLEEATALGHLLPMRQGGVQALLEAAPEADVLILSHTGLEGAAHLGDVWRGRLVRGKVRARVERFARDGIPQRREDREAWLSARWREVDRWISSRTC